MIEIDERVRLPQLLPQLVARDDVAPAGQKEKEDVERASPQPDPPALLVQLTGPAVDLEDTETVEPVLTDIGRHISKDRNCDLNLV